MEATVVSIGKSVLVGALGYARSKAVEEVSLQLGVEGDVAFIADELEMMQSFLMAADEERGQHKAAPARRLSRPSSSPLHCFSSEVGEWVEKRVHYPLPPRPWAPIRVFSHHGRLWWVDLTWGVITCDPFADEPVLGFIPFPQEMVLKCREAWGGSDKYRYVGGASPTASFGLGSCPGHSPQPLFVRPGWVQFLAPPLATWVKHVRDLAYNVEDSLMDFSLLSEKSKSWWCSLRTVGKRRRIAKEIKNLRAKVEDVSNRNLRYRLIGESSGSKPTVAEEQASVATAALFGINEARLAALEHHKSSEVDLHQLITSNCMDLRVIAVWGTTGDLGKMSAIQEVYNDPTIGSNFGFRAWVRLTHPFNPEDFIPSLVRQFYEFSPKNLGEKRKKETIGSNVLRKMKSMSQSEMIDMFDTQVNDCNYLIEIDDLSTIVEWSCIKRYFPDNKKGSRIIVSTQQAEIASLCTEQPYQVSKLNQLSSDQTLYLFHKKINSEEQVSMAGASAATSDINETKLAAVEEDLELQNSEEQISLTSDSAAMFDISKARLAALEKGKRKAQDASCSAQTNSDSNKVTVTEKNAATPPSEIVQELDQRPKNAGEESSSATKQFDRSRTLALGVFTGRETEKSNVIGLVCRPDSNQGCTVISVWGMGGLGKTTLVRSVYQSQQLGGWKRAWVTALRPFNPDILLRDLALQLQMSIQEYPAAARATGAQKKNIEVMKIQDLKEELKRLLTSQKCLVILDDISSTSEWELVKGCLVHARRIILTTREKTIAKHCSGDHGIMYSLEGLKDDAAFDLFIKKVFKMNSKEKHLPPAMMDQARFILKKCNGLPLAISTIGGFLASKPKTAIEWRKISDRISSELEINPELEAIKRVLMKSYDGLPYHLKLAFLYLSIFPEDHKIRWGRLVKRWIAEGYSRDMHGITAEELGRRYLDELLDRSMILPGEELDHLNGKIRFCQLHDIIREICISKAREESLVFTLEDGCCLSSTQGPIRHLVIGSNWKRDKDVLESMLDLSHVRSLTVFGDWTPFFISPKMRFLRVLDLEDTLGLRDHHLDQIGQLLHLKYLSLRRCWNIYSLPNSLGNLKHLQTLDVRATHIFKFPSTITNLRKLQHFHATGCWTGRSLFDTEGEDDILFKYENYARQLSPCLNASGCLWFMFTSPLLVRPQIVDDDLSRSDVVNMFRYHMALVGSKPPGVRIPRGVGKLKALQTLRHVNIARGKGKVSLKELKALTQLRKLGVVGVTIKNSMVFWYAIAGLSQLRSLSVEADEYFGELDGCLDEGLWPPSCLESLKLTGMLVRMTAWIHQLHNLSKLGLQNSRLKQDDGIQALRLLPNLAVLRLNEWSFLGIQFHFQNSFFPSLVVLDLNSLVELECVLFEKDILPKLELLQVVDCCSLKRISGLQVLTRLREIRLDSRYVAVETSTELKENVQKQLAEHLMDVRLIITS